MPKGSLRNVAGILEETQGMLKESLGNPSGMLKASLRAASGIIKEN